MKKIICFLFGHDWNDWFTFDNYGWSATWHNGSSVSVFITIDRRTCNRCNLAQEKERPSKVTHND